MSTLSTLKNTNFSELVRTLSNRGISLSEQSRRTKIKKATLSSYLYDGVMPSFEKGISLLELEESTRV